MQESRTPCSAGERVTVRDEAWVVLRREPFDTVDPVHLQGIGDLNHGRIQSVLVPFDQIERVRQRTGLRHVSRARAVATAARLVAGATPWAQCRVAAAAGIDLLAWQLEPVLAVVNGATRLL